MADGTVLDEFAAGSLSTGQGLLHLFPNATGSG